MSFGTTVMPPYNSTDPTATFLNVSCFDFLLIELVPLAYRITNELEPEPEPSSNGDASSSSPAERRPDEEEKREAAAYRLDMLGYRVGQGIVERLVIPTAALGSWMLLYPYWGTGGPPLLASFPGTFPSGQPRTITAATSSRGGNPPLQTFQDADISFA